MIGLRSAKAAIFRTVEMAKESFVVSVLRGFVLMIGISITLSRLFGMNGVWSSFPVSEGITSAVCIGFIICAGLKKKAAVR